MAITRSAPMLHMAALITEDGTTAQPKPHVRARPNSGEGHYETHNARFFRPRSRALKTEKNTSRRREHSQLEQLVDPQP